MKADVEALRQVEKRFVIEELRSCLRHDLRNKFGSVRNAAYYIRRRVERSAPTLFMEDARIPQFFDLIGSELGAAESLLASTLRPADELRLDSAGVDLVEVMGALLALLEPDPAVAIEVVPGELPSPPRVRGDRTELLVALRALVENAREALAPTGGRVQLQVSLPRPGVVSLEVMDDGPGFVGGASAELAVMPFFSTKPGRLGLGLNIATRIASRSGGNLVLGVGDAQGLRVQLLLAEVESK